MSAILAPSPDHEGIHLKRSIRTVARNKRRWLDHVIANAKFIRNDLSKLWLDKDYPEMISVAAGPSLAADIEQLRALRQGRELICVDAAFRFLIDHGVVPDYVISSDASDKILGMMEGITAEDLRRVKFILNVVAHPDLMTRIDPDQVYWFVMANQFYDLDNKEMIQNMHSLTARVGTKLIPGGNVSSVAMGFALSVRNAEKVHLFGHDFCWKKDMYCGGQFQSLAAERMQDEGRAGTIFSMVNSRGEAVMTNLSLKQFAQWHDEVIACVRRRVVNCTSSTILKGQ